MSHTQGQQLFAGADEAGINDLLRRFFSARPRHLRYGTPAFIPATTSSGTSVPAVSFLGITIDFRIEASIPTVDVTPGGGGTTLVPGPGELVATTTFRFQVRVGGFPDVAGTLGVAARCRPVVVSSSPGVGTIGLSVLQVEIVDITPDWIETIAENLVVALAQTLLGAFTIPFNAFTVGAFGLTLLAGPIADQNQIQVRGNAL